MKKKLDIFLRRYPHFACSVIALFMLLSFHSIDSSAQLNPNPPASPVRLVFIHHSVGENWLAPWNGGLLDTLNANNYYVLDTNYDWGPLDDDVADGTNVGSHTDIGHWYNWFLGTHRATYLQALYNNNILTQGYENSTNIQDPGGENNIVMLKSCFVSVQTIGGQAGDAPTAKGNYNALCGHGTSDDSLEERYTVANIKGLYRDLLDYFSTRQDKLFVLVTSPPVRQGESDEAMPKLRAINMWLVKDWLKNYPYQNVAVFDFSNVLTSNGGNPETNDLGSTTGGHHRFRNGQIEHLVGPTPFLAYATYDPGSSSWDNHPTSAGGLKASGEFLPLLNIAYNRWKNTNSISTEISIPNKITLHQNYPNPFTRSTAIGFWLLAAGHVRLDVFDLLGRKIVTLVDEEKEVGEHSTIFDIQKSKLNISPGMYFYRLTTQRFTATKKFVVRK